MLKKSASFVLTSLRSSTGTRPPHHSAARTDLVRLIRRTVRPRGYASGSSLAAALLTAFLSILFLPSANMVARPSPILLVPEHSQRSLAENPVGAGKPHDQREQHREEEADPKHLWV